MSARTDKVAAAIQAELASLILEEVKDPRVRAAGLLTVTRVDVIPDLRRAKVWVSFIGGADAGVPAALKALERVAPFLRGEVARRLGMRHAPELVFQHDRSYEQQAHIERLLKDDPPKSDDGDGSK